MDYSDPGSYMLYIINLFLQLTKLKFRHKKNSQYCLATQDMNPELLVKLLGKSSCRTIVSLLNELTDAIQPIMSSAGKSRSCGT